MINYKLEDHEELGELLSDPAPGQTLYGAALPLGTESTSNLQTLRMLR